MILNFQIIFAHAKTQKMIGIRGCQMKVGSVLLVKGKTMDDVIISRQKLKDAMYHEAFEKDSDDQKLDSGCWIRYRMFERIINSIPTAQKKGKWIDPDDGYPPYCSECGENCIEYLESAFCPHCGAEMEESEENNG